MRRWKIEIENWDPIHVFFGNIRWYESGLIFLISFEYFWISADIFFNFQLALSDIWPCAVPTTTERSRWENWTQIVITVGNVNIMIKIQIAELFWGEKLELKLWSRLQMLTWTLWLRHRLLSCFEGIKSFRSSLAASRVFHRIMITSEMLRQSYINRKAQNYYRQSNWQLIFYRVLYFVFYGISDMFLSF